MKKRWKGENIDLSLLTTRIGDFFKANDFEAIRKETLKDHQILAEDSPHFKIDGYVSVTVEGRPEDFTVKFDLCTNRVFPLRSIFLETMIFGGYFFSKTLKSEEVGIKLEKEFWRHVENVVLQLGNSAKISAEKYEE